ncbi:MAG TPA: hypothetical protein VJU61_00410, partial [Polyangiaceae bacterium]|nr:hypothetical protein [Polyangiaceae bacterium]
FCWILSAMMCGIVTGCTSSKHTDAKHTEPLPAPPDCRVEQCSGDLRWRVELGGEGSVVVPPVPGILLDDGGIEDPNPVPEPPALAFTEFIAQTGIVVAATGGADTTFAGELLLSDEHVEPESGRGTAVLRIDVDGQLVDHVALPHRGLIEGHHPTRRVLGQDDGSYFLIEHESWSRSAFTLDSASGEPAPFPLAGNGVAHTWGRDLWLSSYPGTPPCRGTSSTSVAIEHWSARGQLSSRTCIDGVEVEEMVSLARGGVAATARTERVAEGGRDVEIDFGSGSRPAYTNQKYLVVWSASGELAWAELLEGDRVHHLQRNPHDELMVHAISQRSRRWQKFAAEGGQLAAGSLTWEEQAATGDDQAITLLDNAGFFITLQVDPAGIADAIMRKWSPEGDLIWEQTIGPVDPVARPAMRVDCAGYIYLLTDGKLAQYAP